MKKGKKYKMPDGTKIRFGGANPNHFQILFIIPHYPIHISFVIRSVDIELHLTYEQNHEHEQIFCIKNDAIKQYVEGLKKQNGIIESCHPGQWWQKYHYRVVDVDVYTLTFHQSSPFCIDPTLLKQNKLSKSNIIKITFTFGYVFDMGGKFKGLLCGDEEHNQVIFMKEVSVKRIIEECVQLQTLDPKINAKMEQFRQNLIKKGVWHNSTTPPPWHSQFPT